MKPLGLPVGSVRAIIAILSVIFLFVSGLFGKTELLNIFQNIAIAVIGFYFGSRKNDII